MSPQVLTRYGKATKPHLDNLQIFMAERECSNHWHTTSFKASAILRRRVHPQRTCSHHSRGKIRIYIYIYTHIHILESTVAHSRALDSHALGIWEAGNHSCVQAQALSDHTHSPTSRLKREAKCVNDHKNTHTHTDQKTNKQTNKQTKTKQTYKQTNKQTALKSTLARTAHTHTHTHTHTRTHTHTHAHTHPHTHARKHTQISHRSPISHMGQLNHDTCIRAKTYTL